jgi:hypothetical protein
MIRQADARSECGRHPQGAVVAGRAEAMGVAAQSSFRSCHGSTLSPLVMRAMLSIETSMLTRTPRRQAQQFGGANPCAKRSRPLAIGPRLCENSTWYNRTQNFEACGRAQSNKTQKFVLRSALRPNQISFSHSLGQEQTPVIRPASRYPMPSPITFRCGNPAPAAPSCCHPGLRSRRSWRNLCAWGRARVQNPRPRH